MKCKSWVIDRGDHALVSVSFRQVYCCLPSVQSHRVPIGSSGGETSSREWVVFRDGRLLRSSRGLTK